MGTYTHQQFAEKLGANGDPKLNAAADFAARLLNGPEGDRVARIVLFGSVARGEAGSGSDVDLLVIGVDNLDSLQQQARAAAADILLEGSDCVSPMVYDLAETEYPPTWFLYHSLKTGREVYRMNEAELRRREAEGWWALATEYLRQARRASQDGSFRLAVDGAYNAAELAVKGLLILRIEQLPRSHGGLVQIFGREYVTTGAVDRLLSHRLSAALESRSKARYDRGAKIAAEHVEEAAALAEELISLLEQALVSVERGESESPEP